MQSGNTCVPVPTPTKKVFVTSELYTGDLREAQISDGLTGGDAKCQRLALAAGLAGQYKAWLSSNIVAAKDRLTHSTVPYVEVDGTRVADNWDAMVNSCVLLHGIALTETGGPAPLAPFATAVCGNTSAVRTGTDCRGANDGHGYDLCRDWTSTVGGGETGLSGTTGPSWTLYCAAGGGMCSGPAPIYCFQQ